MAHSKVRETLENIGAISSASVYQFASRTRDREIPVFRDSITGVIFIDEFYVGDDEYASGAYRSTSSVPDFEDLADTRRRVSAMKPFYVGKSVVDFGCGRGSFLRSIDRVTLSATGIELQASFRAALNRDGIMCSRSIREISSPVDTIFAFHVVEHLPDPLASLKELKRLLDPVNGSLIIEVPNANDFLISQLGCQAFIDHTLWSQHLVLHTRESLNNLLKASGFSKVLITGIQRYGLANHLSWLTSGKPGGHRSSLASIESPMLQEAYEFALAAQDHTDTLIAVANP